MYEGIAHALSAAEVNGALLEAAGPVIIIESVAGTTLARKHTASNIKIHAAHIHRRAVEEGARGGEAKDNDAERSSSSPGDYYWRASTLITGAFVGSLLEQPLRDALTPQPRAAVLYTRATVYDRDRLDVASVVEDLSPWCEPEAPQRFRVVTVLCPEQPEPPGTFDRGARKKPGGGCVAAARKRGGGRSSRSGGGGGGSGDASSSPSSQGGMLVAKQNLVFFRTESDEWSLLASVDFEAHGSARPGHWHVNRAPLGEPVPHWGPKGSVLHGEPESAPLFWMLIPPPEVARYACVPHRAALASLLDAAAASGGTGGGSGSGSRACAKRGAAVA